MKKLEQRAILCLLLAMAMLAGLVLFVWRLETNGGQWASFYANRHIYTDGNLAVGAIYDRNGKLLLKNTADGPEYHDDASTRKAVFHVVGDPGGNVATGANAVFRSKMVGYNPITGTSGFLTNRGKNITLTIDSRVSRVAYDALGGHKGFVSVYNWRTGEILAAVSAPTTDPAGSGEVAAGTYLNNVFSGTFAPGSTFKLVTTAAAIDTMTDLEDWSYKCTGKQQLDGGEITCPFVHGQVDFYGALAKSCNCAYATLAVDIGPGTMEDYVDMLQLTESYDVDGIETARGDFTFFADDVDLGWAGIGQFEDQVNPLAMMVYMGAIAGDGRAANPVILGGTTILEKGAELLSKDGEKAENGTVTLLDSKTAGQLQQMMRNNVKATYKDENFPGLEVFAKSGTAETGPGITPNAWFVGYCGDYAFAVCVEQGGYGAQVAAPVVNKVLQEMKTLEYFE